MTLTEQILELAHLRSLQIAERLGCSARYARRILKRHGLAHPVGPPDGPDNPAWVGGRSIDLDGYVKVSAGPYQILEHRMLLEHHLGRGLRKGEVVDHIDGLTLHNILENLRLFPSNAAHLEATLRECPQWSASGRRNIRQRGLLPYVPVSTYRLRKERGDVRLRAILRAALEL